MSRTPTEKKGKRSKKHDDLTEVSEGGIGSKTNIFALALIILTVALIRARILQVPFERDEGEYAYIGRLILQGVPPYLTAYDIKFPGAYLMYALLMSFLGQTLPGVHLGLLIVNSITILLIYFLGHRFNGGLTGIVAAGAYGFMSLDIGVVGFAAHVSHFVVLFVVAGLLIFIRCMQLRRGFSGYLLAGIVSGVALAVKQAAIFLIAAPACSMIVAHLTAKPRRPLRELASPLGGFALGVPIPILAICGWLYLTGAFPRFWFWAVDFASRFAVQNDLSFGLHTFAATFPGVVDGFVLVWIMAAAGIYACRRQVSLKVERLLLPLFALFSFFSVCPALFFRQHYFIMLLPAVALLAGTFTDYVKRRLESTRSAAFSTALAGGLAVIAICTGVVINVGYYFRDDMTTISRTAYGPNPFPESIPFAEYITARTSESDRIAVIGSEPQIYFYSGRNSVTPYVDIYNLTIAHPCALAMQKEMIHDIESSKPRYIVVSEVPQSWMIQPKSEKYLLDWYRPYMEQNYHVVGIADIIDARHTTYKWDADAAGYQPRGNFMVLCERK